MNSTTEIEEENLEREKKQQENKQDMHMHTVKRGELPR